MSSESESSGDASASRTSEADKQLSAVPLLIAGYYNKTVKLGDLASAVSQVNQVFRKKTARNTGTP
ncbi:MAG: hypothetical protein U0939_05960 [Pirellulales bacterium]